MKKIHRYIRSSTLLGLAVCIGACENTVDLEFPTHDPLILINSFFKNTISFFHI